MDFTYETWEFDGSWVAEVYANGKHVKTVTVTEPGCTETDARWAAQDWAGRNAARLNG